MRRTPRVAVGTHVRAVLFESNDVLFAAHDTKWPMYQSISGVSEETLKAHWGKPFSEFVQSAYGAQNSAAAIEKFRGIYNRYPKRLIASSGETVRRLHTAGYVLGIVTWDSSENLFRDFRDTHGLNQNIFSYVQAEEDSIQHKPDTCVFEPAYAWLRSRGIQPHETLYIGCEPQDAHASLVPGGFGYINVSTGLTPPEEFDRRGLVNIASLGELALR